MEEQVYQIRSYLPVEFDDQETNEFIDYLVAAYLENFSNNKYQFSFTAFHMLYMSFIYKVKWCLRQNGDVLIEDLLAEFTKRNSGASFNTLFDFSQLSEKSSLEKLLKTLSFHANDVDLCKNLVEVRNKCAHASGKIYFKRQTQVENYIMEEMDSTQAIQKKMKPYIKSILEEYVAKIWNSNWIVNDVHDWIIENYFSQKDIEDLLQVKFVFLKQDSNSKEVVLKKLLYASIVSEFVKYIDFTNDFFIKSLIALMKGLINEINIGESDIDDIKMKSTQVLIEEKILPLLTDLSTEDSLKAQEILNYAASD